MEKPRRNAPCPCGSGIKYKLCCRLTQDRPHPSYEPPPGSTIRIVFDWYEVHDCAALTQLLGRQPDVVSCRAQGWSRIDPARPHLEPSALLEVVQDESRLEVTTPSESTADTTRWWLERIAGELLTYEVGGLWEEENRNGAILSFSSMAGRAPRPGRLQRASVLLGIDLRRQIQVEARRACQHRLARQAAAGLEEERAAGQDARAPST